MSTGWPARAEVGGEMTTVRGGVQSPVPAATDTGVERGLS